MLGPKGVNLRKGKVQVGWRLNAWQGKVQAIKESLGEVNSKQKNTLGKILGLHIALCLTL